MQSFRDLDDITSPEQVQSRRNKRSKKHREKSSRDVTSTRFTDHIQAVSISSAEKEKKRAQSKTTSSTELKAQDYENSSSTSFTPAVNENANKSTKKKVTPTPHEASVAMMVASGSATTHSRLPSRTYNDNLQRAAQLALGISQRTQTLSDEESRGTQLLPLSMKHSSDPELHGQVKIQSQLNREQDDYRDPITNESNNSGTVYSNFGTKFKANSRISGHTMDRTPLNSSEKRENTSGRGKLVHEPNMSSSMNSKMQRHKAEDDSIYSTELIDTIDRIKFNDGNTHKNHGGKQSTGAHGIVEPSYQVETKYQTKKSKKKHKSNKDKDVVRFSPIEANNNQQKARVNNEPAFAALVEDRLQKKKKKKKQAREDLASQNIQPAKSISQQQPELKDQSAAESEAISHEVSTSQKKGKKKKKKKRRRLQAEVENNQTLYQPYLIQRTDINATSPEEYQYMSHEHVLGNEEVDLIEHDLKNEKRNTENGQDKKTQSPDSRKKKKRKLEAVEAESHALTGYANAITLETDTASSSINPRKKKKHKHHKIIASELEPRFNGDSVAELANNERLSQMSPNSMTDGTSNPKNTSNRGLHEANRSHCDARASFQSTSVVDSASTDADCDVAMADSNLKAEHGTDNSLLRSQKKTRASTNKKQQKKYETMAQLPADDVPTPSRVHLKGFLKEVSSKTVERPKTILLTTDLIKPQPLPEGGFISGELSQTEKRAFADTIVSFRSQRHLTEFEVNSIVQGGTNLPDLETELWNALVIAVPHRKKTKLRDYGRKNFHNFEARGKWTSEQDQELIQLHKKYGDKWRQIGDMINRHQVDVRDRWRNYLACGKSLTKGHWSKEEESQLVASVARAVKRIEAERKRDRGRDWDVIPSDEKIDFGSISAAMGHQRSRLQCATKWKMLKEHFDLDTLLTMDLDTEEMALPGLNVLNARDEYHRMTLKQKMDLIGGILAMKVKNDHLIRWSKAASPELRRNFSTRGLQLAWFRMKARIPDYESIDVISTCEQLINIYGDGSDRTDEESQDDDMFDTEALRTLSSRAPVPQKLDNLRAKPAGLVMSSEHIHQSDLDNDEPITDTKNADSYSSDDEEDHWYDAQDDRESIDLGELKEEKEEDKEGEQGLSRRNRYEDDSDISTTPRRRMHFSFSDSPESDNRDSRSDLNFVAQASKKDQTTRTPDSTIGGRRLMSISTGEYPRNETSLSSAASLYDNIV